MLVLMIVDLAISLIRIIYNASSVIMGAKIVMDLATINATNALMGTSCRMANVYPTAPNIYYRILITDNAFKRIHRSVPQTARRVH